MHTKVITGFVVGAAMLPFSAFAQSSDTQAQIQALLSQIQALQLQLRNLVASSTSQDEGGNRGLGQFVGGVLGDLGQFMGEGKEHCPRFDRDLKHGMRGDDVKELQNMLREDDDSGFDGEATGFFGSMTAKAMMRFQMKNGIASSTDGTVGPKTRGFFEKRCGKDGQGMMRGGVGGTITATGASTITIQPENASTTSVLVNVSASTTIKVFMGTSTPTTGSMSDLMVGKKVRVEGKKQTDGSINAIHIMVGDFPAAPMQMGFKLEDEFKNMMHGKGFGGNRGSGGGN